MPNKFKPVPDVIEDVWINKDYSHERLLKYAIEL